MLLQYFQHLVRRLHNLSNLTKQFIMADGSKVDLSEVNAFDKGKLSKADTKEKVHKPDAYGNSNIESYELVATSYSL